MRSVRHLVGSLALAGALTVGAAPALSGEIAIQNLDGVPSDDHLAFNTFGNTKGFAVHDVVTLRILNEDATPLAVTDLRVTGEFALADPVALPAAIPAGGSLDVGVRYTATSEGSPDPNRHTGTLEIDTDDADEPTTTVTLGGVWSPAPQGGNEPPLDDTIAAFGYGTVIVGPGETTKTKGKVIAIGDEVLSPYWQAADDGTPVHIRQLNASHGNSSSPIQWYPVGTNDLTEVFNGAGEDPQSLLPRLAGDLSSPAEGAFAPPSGERFGFKVSRVWSDDLRNAYADNCNPPYPTLPDGRTCGHYMRFWPLKDSGGTVVPNSYLMSIDLPVGNDDYQDYIFLIDNIEPAGSAPDTLGPEVAATSHEDGAEDVGVADNIRLSFLEAIAGASVTPANVTLTAGGEEIPTTLSLSKGKDRITIDPDEDLAEGTVHTLTLGPGLTDNSGNPVQGAPVTYTFTTEGAPPPPPPPPPPPGDGAFQPQDGTVVMEAESGELIDRSGTGWTTSGVPAGAVGDGLVIPDAGQGWGSLATVPDDAPEIRFTVDFAEPGTYNIFVRGYPKDTAGNSVHIGNEGTVTATSDHITHSGYGTWRWMKYSAGGPNPGTITVPSAGPRTISIYGREDGTAVDRIVLSTSATTPSGTGPDESPRDGDPPPPPPPPPPTGAFQFEGSQVVIDAESADAVVDRSGTGWQAESLAGAVGQVMRVPNAGDSWGNIATVPAEAPELSYEVEFPAAGTYRLAVRGNAPNTAGNSVHVGLNGALTASSDFLNTGTFNAFTWLAKSTGGPNPATISVPGAGVHTVNVWAREDGFAVDRLVIAQPGTATPTGDGPAESPRG